MKRLTNNGRDFPETLSSLQYWQSLVLILTFSVLVILFILSLNLRHILGTFCPRSLCRMKTLTQTRNYTSEELYSIEILLLEEKASALKIKTEPGCRRKAIKSDCISCKAQRRIFLFQICFRLCWKHQEIYSKFLWRKSAK